MDREQYVQPLTSSSALSRSADGPLRRCSLISTFRSSRRFRKAGYAAVDRICDYFENIESYDVVPKVEPGDIAKMIARTTTVSSTAECSR